MRSAEPERAERQLAPEHPVDVASQEEREHAALLTPPATDELERQASSDRDRQPQPLRRAGMFAGAEDRVAGGEVAGRVSRPAGGQASLPAMDHARCRREYAA